MRLLLRYVFFAWLVGSVIASCTAKKKIAVLQSDTAVFDVPYTRQSDRQKLDIYLPARAKGARLPVIIGIHGGAFFSGDKKKESFVYKNGLKRGYAVVCVNYRLSGEAVFPAQILDVKTAIRWVKAHAREYDLDTARIAVWGTSAGGYLAALAGTSGHVRELEDKTMGYPEHTSKVQAVVDWYGPIDFLTMDSQNEETGMAPVFGTRHNDSKSPESLLMGAPIQEIPDQVRVSNPERYISKDDPCFYIQHGLADDHVPWKQSQVFADKLIKILGKDKVFLHLVEGVGHATDPFFTEENYAKSLDFLDKMFRQDSNKHTKRR
ncbi:MAG: alpha/beta hydrolase [Niabella sp.]